MSLFNLPVVHKQTKPASEHPWAKTIKEHYANKIKRAHNSVRNVVYPKAKERIPLEKRVTFTVIGNRVSKEFIYCVKMVQGMHKYRWKHYDTPVIRGCTEVEWPEILHVILETNSGLKYCHDTQAVVLRDGHLIGGEQELKELIESEYIYHLVLNYQKESLKLFTDYLKASGRPCAYMHISIDEKPIGSLIFMLYSDIAPVTCENFLRLCQAKTGGYSGTPVHRVVKDGWIQCGGFGLKNTNMDCENFIVPHDKRGVLGMANAGRHIDCSTQFYVLLQPNEWLKFRFTAFGQLIEGEQTLKKIEEIKTYYEAPTSNIIIYSAGIVNLDCQDIRINEGALEYLNGHVEDLVTIGEMFYEMLLERVCLEIDFRRIERLEATELIEEEDYGEAFQETVDADGNIMKKHIQATRRFLHTKGETQTIRNNLKAKGAESIKTQNENSRFNKGKPKSNHATSSAGGTSLKSSIGNRNENMQFDVEEYEYDNKYEYEREEHSFIQMTPISHANASKPHFIPLTDVPYPGEVDSNFDLKRLLQGDYCLKADIGPSKSRMRSNKSKVKHKLNAVSLIISMQSDLECASSSSKQSSAESLDSEDRKEIINYLSLYGDKVSFSGDRVQNIAKQSFKVHPLEEKESNVQQFQSYTRIFFREADASPTTARKSPPGVRKEWFTDEDIRLMRTALRDYKDTSKNVSFKAPIKYETGSRIMRRPTGFLKPDESINLYRKQHEEDEEIEDDYLTLEKGKTIELGDSTDPRHYRRRKTQPRVSEVTRKEDLEEEEHLKNTIVHIVPEDTLRTSQRLSALHKRSFDDADPSSQRQSVLLRLFDDVDMIDNDPAPKLKDFKGHDEIGKKKMKLAMSDSDIQLTTILHREKQHLPEYQGSEIINFDQEMRRSIQLNRIKMGTGQPKISVSEYRKKNEVRREQAKKQEVEIKKTLYSGSIRLPGDTPVYSPRVSIFSRI